MLVAVRWTDAHIVEDWSPGDPLECPIAVTYGRVIEDTKKHLAVAHEEFEDGRCRQVTVVPREMIVEVQKLRRLP